MKPQTRTVLALLRIHPEGLTPLEALQWGAGFRLGARIYELREAGYRIDNEWETSASGRYARYVLHEEPEQLRLAV